MEWNHFKTFTRATIRSPPRAPFPMKRALRRVCSPWGYGLLALVLLGSSSLFVYDLDDLETSNAGAEVPLILNPTPFVLNPEPLTLHPKPYTLSPTPETL